MLSSIFTVCNIKMTPNSPMHSPVWWHQSRYVDIFWYGVCTESCHKRQTYINLTYLSCVTRCTIFIWIGMTCLSIRPAGVLHELEQSYVKLWHFSISTGISLTTQHPAWHDKYQHTYMYVCQINNSRNSLPLVLCQLKCYIEIAILI